MTSADAPTELRRTLGLWPVTISGVGIILGAGIYVLVGEAASSAGSATWVAFLIGGVVASLTGLSFAELAGMFPESGGSAAYTEEAFGRRAGFLAGWLAVTVNVVGAAAVALGFGGYAADLIGGDGRAIALGVLVTSALVVYAGVRETISVAILFAALEAIGLLFVIVVGIPYLPGPSPLEAPEGVIGILAATAIVFFAFQGFENIVSLAEEAEDPTSTVPKAIVLAIGATSAIYLLVAAVATAVVPWDTLADAPAPLSMVVATASNDRFADALSVLALFATFNTVLLLLATGARVTYGMANRRLLPAVFGRLSSRKTPWVAALGLTGLALAFALSGNIGFVAQVTNFAVFVQFIAVNAAMIQLRRSQPGLDRPFRTHGRIGGVPLTPVLGIATTLLLAAFLERTAFVTGLIALALGVVVSLVVLRGRSD